MPEHPVPEQGAELPSDLRAALLDPALWHETLQKYALTTNLAVALVDAEGRLLGECLNPRPTWKLFQTRDLAAGSCPFALTPVQPCACWADALDEGGVVHCRDRTGLVHFAVPLALNGQPLGALLAGQVFDQYPEQLPLEHAAMKLGLPAQKVWRLARLEQPVKHATLEVYAGLLATLGQTFLQTHYHTLMEADRLAEMTRLRDQLADADRRKNEFLAMLAHELRNPLAPLGNAVAILRLGGAAQADPNWAIDVMDRQMQQLKRLVDDLLDVSRITSGKVQLHREPVDAAAVVARAVEISRHHIDARQQELTVALPPESVWVEADPIRLAQILTNLLNNAAKYTAEGGRIWLTVERASEGSEPLGEVLFRVRDTGVGIAPDMLDRVFDLFSQADSSLAHAEGGLGIGLTMVRSIVELHGGSVRATSGGLGQGSEFIVRLPICDHQLTSKEIGDDSNQPSAIANQQPLRILVVDDNRDAAESLAVLLRLEGHTVQVAHDGEAALATAQAFQPAVVLLDIGLPRMDGYEVARRLRHEANGEEVMLVALTGYGQEEDHRRSRESGFDHHLVKPVELDDLQALLSAYDTV